nr:arsenical pump-driving ATPase [Paratrimastix eleionoma]
MGVNCQMEGLGKEEEEAPLSFPPTLQNLIDQTSLRWIFVGGKGGVGKTTSSCSLAIQLSSVREKVLLVSTDPAHSISDALDQKFCGEPTMVKGFANLYAMEVDSKFNQDDFEDVTQQLRGIVSDAAASLPGMDEAVSFALLMRHVQTMNFSTVVFDTAPTGHTLRLLSFPAMVARTLRQIINLKSSFGGFVTQIANVVFPGKSAFSSDSFARMEELQQSAQEVVNWFQNPDLTTFVCVCIPEFLSLYETERMIQDLSKDGIDVHNILINQIIVPSKDHPCSLCLARRRMQQRYLDQFQELYGDFHLTKLPLLTAEVRGVENLRIYSHWLLNPCPIQEVEPIPPCAKPIPVSFPFSENKIE